MRTSPTTVLFYSKFPELSIEMTRLKITTCSVSFNELYNAQTRFIYITFNRTITSSAPISTQHLRESHGVSLDCFSV